MSAPAPAPIDPPRPRSISLTEAFIIGAIFCVVLGAAGAFAVHRFNDVNASRGFLGQFQRERLMTDFQGIGSDAAPFQLAKLRGEVVLVTFGFTRCPDVCPDTLGKLASVLKALPPAAREKVRVVFVSVDPRDDPSTLRGYLPFYEPSIFGVTGSRAQAEAAARAFGAQIEVKVPAANAPDEPYRVLHSDFVYAVDPAGRYTLRFFHAHLNDPERIAADLVRLLAEGT